MASNEGPKIQTECISGTADVKGYQANYTLEFPVDIDTVSHPFAEVLHRGFGVRDRDYIGLRQTLAQLGMAVINLEPAHGPTNLEDPLFWRWMSVLAVQNAVRDRKELPKGLDYDKFGHDAHSQGGPVSLAAAIREPSEVAFIKFLSTAGSETQVTLGNRAMDLAEFSAWFFVKTLTTRSRKQSGRNIGLMLSQFVSFWGDPAGYINEGLDAASCSISPEIIELNEEFGIPFGAALFSDDSLIRQRRFNPGLRPYMHIVEVKADHPDPITKPELIAPVLVDMTEVLRQRIAA